MLKCARSDPQNGQSYSDSGRAVKAGSFANNAVFVNELASSRYERSAWGILKCYEHEAGAEVIAAFLLYKLRTFAVGRKVTMTLIRHHLGIHLMHQLGNTFLIFSRWRAVRCRHGI